MSLLGSSKGSKPYRSGSSRKGRPSGPASTKTSKGDQDLPLKLCAASALAASGYYCNINVTLSAIAERGLADVTDADVLAINHDLTFSPRIISVSCKSGQNVTIAKEIFYLRGVLTYLRADEGVALFSLTTIPPHLRDLGRQLGVLVLSGKETEEWSKSVTNGLPSPGYFDESRYEALCDFLAGAKPSDLADWLRYDFWFFRDFRNLSRGISRIRTLAPSLTGTSIWHEVIFLNFAAHFSLTILDLCREVRMLGLEAVQETAAAYLFGGASSFRGRKELYSRVEKMLNATGVLDRSGPTLPSLEPGYTPALAELALRFVERPQSAILVPQVLQNALWKALGASGLSFDNDVKSIAAQKLAQDLLTFIRTASGATWSPRLLRRVEK